MIYRSKYLSLFVVLIGGLFFSVALNFYLYEKVSNLENSAHFTRCGTNEYEFHKLQDEIKRLENNPFLHIGEQKSVLKNMGE